MQSTEIRGTRAESFEVAGPSKVRKQDRITREALQERFDRPLLDVVSATGAARTIYPESAPSTSGEGIRCVSNLHQENGLERAKSEKKYQRK